MMKMFLSSMILMLTLFMYFLTHPLSMGLFILLQTMLICILSGMMIKTYWFSYILFLTFLGGLLVLFIYVSSIASNEMFNMNMKMKITFLYLIMFFFMISMFMMNNLKYMNFYFNSDMEIYFNLNFFNNENKMNLTKLYNSQTFYLMMMLIIYLFITLISVVKITNISYGPIRSNF
uniref:NADH-ubiquinone oxidoreductase chain 6 n=1 Tax=Histia rhodope TaxID=1453155 RepID=A0A346HH11_9NEOP|nr:NADH dehydrogenase subunit 6 [Histia rhodope]AXO78697.1 NADH dehydrogenase subunit 6 [Histia rhodope]UNO31881.1 NADH dehydrogenase subunit 6 [Histia rhodope]